MSIETTADVFARHGIALAKANTARRQGAAALRRMLTKKQPDSTLGTPNLLICDTPGNRWAIEMMLELTPDPTDPEDVLKVDANDEGHGGDDAYDCLRYGTLVPANTHEEPIIQPVGDQGRDPSVKMGRGYKWVGPESEEAQQEYTHGIGGQLPVGYGL